MAACQLAAAALQADRPILWLCCVAAALNAVNLAANAVQRVLPRSCLARGAADDSASRPRHVHDTSLRQALTSR